MTADDEELLARARQRIGTTLRDKYRLDRVLGVGGMAAVYAATHRNKKRFAVKVLHPEISMRSELRERFLREGYAANSVEHPGTVAVLDDDVAEDGSAFLVMELLDGETVEGLWEAAGHKLPVETVLSVGLQLLDVLASAHAHGVVHRDIKPANLFLLRDGRLKVLDFGIARVRDAANATATQTGAVFGTPAFMSPEQALGNSADIDALTDVWAAGATMFTLLSGRYVHEAGSTQGVMIKAATTPAPALASFVADVPPQVGAAVDRALVFDRSKRWPSAKAMWEGLRDASLEVLGRVPAPPPPPEVSDPALARTMATGPASSGRVDLVAAAASTTAAVSSGSPTRSQLDARPLRRRPTVIAAAVAVGVLVTAAVVLGRRHQTATAPATTPSAQPAATAVTDLPVPESKSLEAVAAFKAGLQTSRDGAAQSTLNDFRRAAELDPTMAAAHLRLADIAFRTGDVTTARSAFEKASQLRAALTDRERALLAIQESVITHSPPDYAGALRGADEAIARHPLDAEFFVARAWVRYGKTNPDVPGVRSDATRALELDPQYADATALQGLSYENEHDDDDALAAYDHCLAISTSATTCRFRRMAIHARKGQCVNMGEDADQAALSAPSDPAGFRYQALFLAWHGAATDTVREALRQSWEADAPSKRADRRLRSQEYLALWSGDFISAEAVTHEHERALAESTDLRMHSRQTWALVQALLESGRLHDAGVAADAFLKRQEAWAMNSWGAGVARDDTPHILEVARRSGVIPFAQWAQKRDAWLARWKATGMTDANLDFATYLLPVETRADSQVGLARLPGMQPVDSGLWNNLGFVLGKAYLLAGQTDEAIPELRRAASNCLALEAPVDTMRASLMLGHALAEKGDKPGACAAYQTVIDRWGAAKPRSVTADEAKQAAGRLGCERPHG